MKLPIEIEETARPSVRYFLTDSEIGNACREAENMLASYGIDRDATASALGV